MHNAGSTEAVDHRRNARPLTCLLGAGLLLGTAAAMNAGAATTASFLRLYDSTTAVPGGSGAFSSLSAPALDGSDLAFRGGDSRAGVPANAVFVDDGTDLDRYTDDSTPVPNGIGNFFLLGRLTLDDGTVVFRDQTFTAQGIYVDDGTGATVVADLTTQVPGAANGVLFDDFEEQPWIDDDVVVFMGGSGSLDGVYRDDSGTLTRIVDTTTAVPDGAGIFTGFRGFPSIDGNTVAFVARLAGGEEALYTETGGTLSRQVDTATAIPDGVGNFTALFRPLLSEGNIAFSGLGSGNRTGIYLYDGLTVRRIADNSTPIPGGTGNFVNFSAHTISGQHVAVLATGSGGQRGVYIDRGHGLEKVLAQGDTLDGAAVTLVNMEFQALKGDQLGISVVLDSAVPAIYLVEFDDLADEEPVAVPAPPWMMLALMALLAGTGARRLRLK